jgi:copper chaperone CopZ
MRIFITLVAAMCLTTSSLPAHAQDAPAAKPTLTKAKLLITGLHCPPCTNTVQHSLAKVPGVKSISVNWGSKNALVEFDENVLPVQILSQRVAATPHMMGRGMQYSGWLALQVPLVKDESSGKKVKEALSGVKGIKQVTVYPSQKAIGILFSSDGKVTTQDVIERLAKAEIEASNY